LIGRPHFTEYCIGCNDDTRPCNCSYADWSAKLHDFVTAKVAIRAVPGKGFGGFARGRIYKEAFVGEFSGQLLPCKAKELSEADQYYSSIMIGEFYGMYEGHVSAWVDSAYIGTVSRVYNHSCEPNTKIWEYRCGMGHRILVYQTLRVIEEGEEITIDYGERWFRGPDQRCLCGTASCKNPATTVERVKDAIARKATP
jgi:SET domain-containing protein